MFTKLLTCHTVKVVSTNCCWYLKKAIQDCLIDWVFNSTSTQKGQFVPTAEKMAKVATDGQRDTINYLMFL